MCSLERPLPLLFFHEAFADDLIDGRLHERSADGVTVTIPFAKVRNEVVIVANVRREFGDASGQLGDCS